MKRLLTSILLFAAFLCGAQAQNDALFVYRNDGAIHGFLRADIDSMVCSQIDLDSLLHADYVVQEIWTADSVYRIPLAAIDSISFVTPPTKYKEGVTKIEESLLPYVVGADSLTLKLKSDTPSYLLPQTGDLLVLLEGCEVLPYGFAGKVETVNTLGDCVEVVCEQTYIEDVFDSFCSVQTMVGYAEESENASSQRSPSSPDRITYNPDDKIFELGPYTISLTSELSQGIIPSGDLALAGGTAASIRISPTFRIHTLVILEIKRGLLIECSLKGDLRVSSQVSVYGNLGDLEQKLLNPVINFPIANTAGLVNFYLHPGGFIRGSAAITSTVKDRRDYEFGMSYGYSSKGENVIKPSLDGRLVSSSTDVEGSIDGSLAMGGYLEVGFNLWSRDIARACVLGEMGMQLNGNFVLCNSDIEEAESSTVLYKRLKASSLEWGPFVNVSLIASYDDTQAVLTWPISSVDKRWDFVPTFSSTELTHTPGSATSADASTDLSGECFVPVPVGYKLFDADMNEVADYDAPESYTKPLYSPLEYSFENLSQNVDYYEVYPTVRLFGYEMLATPSDKMVMNGYPVITAFEVTDSEYKSGAFMNNGLSYDYKYDVDLTVEIGNLEGVADWGYVCKDMFDDGYKRISLMKYGQSYTGKHTFYRNEAHSTAPLSTYVLYEGDFDFLWYDSEPQDYPLDHKVNYCAHPVITAFEVTDSEHKEGAFLNANDGRYYDYKFDVALTAEVDSLEGVADWGYAYRDPYGNVKRISLMEYGQSYTDTRYAYYRNEAHSTACLYTYVRYEGDSEYYDGEPHDYPLDHEDKVFSCPDGHHPHAIDLGLPSGTKWACCNIGASSPEGYGGYYAWGETSEKDYYDEDNYAHYNSQTGEWISLGSDIAGTSYDVAHVQWGGSWVMPSRDRQVELMGYCSREWTTVNGVYGTLVTGLSGGQIFLPAAGYRWGDSLYDAGSFGHYWSGTQDPYYSSIACYLYFYSSYWDWDYNYCGNGQSVRAVCP